MAAVIAAAFFISEFAEPEAPDKTSTGPAAALGTAARFSPQAVGYVDSTACAGCHQEIWESYRQTGMGRAFSRLTPEASIADFSKQNTYYHKPSDRHYTLHRKGDAFYMRRYQIGFNGRATNVFEKRIDYVIGSGYKARTYLSRNSQGELLQLPVAWYTEKGGFWAMNPGYDRPDHDGFLRRVKFDCMACHNAYVETGPQGDAFDADPIFGEKLTEGIDCQRCHGPGRAHLEALANEDSEEAVRGSIVNPGTLEPERQLEVCMQCHLQSTSFRLPYASQRPGRGVFSYRPGEPLADFMLHFDHPPGAGYDDKFEIAHAAYRLLKSRCFEAGEGALTCSTCHDPHSHLIQSDQHYVEVCQSCHPGDPAELLPEGRHPASRDCLGCHMPQRRTDDVVHVVMTDHYIQRHKPNRDLLAPRQEIVETSDGGYRGELALLYPPEVPPTPANELDVAVAQVEAGTNLAGGIPRLRSAIEKYQPQSHLYYYELAEAYLKNGQVEEAFLWWEEAIRRKPDFLPALRNYGKELAKAGRFDKAFEILGRALEIRPDDPRASHDLALAYFLQGNSSDGLAMLRKAVQADPDVAEAQNLLATQLYAAGDVGGAEEAFRNAIRVEPRYGMGHANLAGLLAEKGRLDEAEFHYKKAVFFTPEYAKGRLDYGVFLADHRRRFEEALTHLRAAVGTAGSSAPARVGLGYVLGRSGDFTAAIRELQRAVELDPASVEAHLYLASAFEEQGELAQAQGHYEKVLGYNPSHHGAYYGLGAVMAKQGKPEEALRHFRKASETPNPQLRELSLKAVREIEARR